jgi:hypothetical protein
MTFVEAVRGMREAQKGFFKSERGSAEKAQFLTDSRAAEKRVDQMLSEMSRNPSENIFGGDE